VDARPRAVPAPCDSNISAANHIPGAKLGANDHGHRATSGHTQPLPEQSNGTSGHTWHRLATFRKCLLSSSSHRLVLFIRNNARESPPTAAAVTPGLQKSFVNTNPNFHHYWEAPGGTNDFSFMCSTTKCQSLGTWEVRGQRLSRAFGRCPHACPASRQGSRACPRARGSRCQDGRPPVSRSHRKQLDVQIIRI
jgi:hypothetical protein